MFPFEAHFTLDTFPLSILFASYTQSILIFVRALLCSLILCLWRSRIRRIGSFVLSSGHPMITGLSSQIVPTWLKDRGRQQCFQLVKNAPMMVPLIESHGTTTWALKDVFEAVEIQHPGEAKPTIGPYFDLYCIARLFWAILIAI